jgi:asparagine synthase (glutamine-hydrolysing)
MDLELLKFAFQIPISLRHNHYIYKQWIVKKYPLAAKYIWERTGKKIHEREYIIKIKGNDYELSKIIPKISNKILNDLFGRKNISKSNMNPSEYYYNSNKKLFNFTKKYFKDGLEHINDLNLRNDLLGLFNSNDHNGKHLALTLLSAIKMFKITN